MTLFDKVRQLSGQLDHTKFDKELDRLRQVVQVRPNDTDALRQLGTICETNDMPEEAIHYFGVLAKIYHQSGQGSLAVAYLNKAEKLADTEQRASILKDIANVHISLKQYEEAYRTSRRVIDIYIEINQKEAGRGFLANLPSLGEKDALYRKEMREMIGEKDEKWAQGARGSWVAENTPKPMQLGINLPGYATSKVPVTPQEEKALFAQLMVLVVDDDPSIIKIITAMLKSLGCQTDFANDGEAGFDKAFEIRPNLIISDLLMPKLDGSQFFDKLQQYNETKSIPFVCLTSRGQEDEKIAAFDRGIEDYWVKPFIISEISMRTKKILYRQLNSKKTDTGIDLGQSELLGRIGNIPIPHLLRMLEYMRKTGVLTMQSSDSQGLIALNDGNIVDAQLSGMVGEEAFFSLITWNEGIFSFEPREIFISPTINDSLDGLFAKLAQLYPS